MLIHIHTHTNFYFTSGCPWVFTWYSSSSGMTFKRKFDFFARMIIFMFYDDDEMCLLHILNLIRKHKISPLLACQCNKKWFSTLIYFNVIHVPTKYLILSTFSWLIASHNSIKLIDFYVDFDQISILHLLFFIRLNLQ